MITEKNRTRLFSDKDGTNVITDIRAWLAKLPALILQLILHARDLSEPVIEKAISIAESVGSVIEKGTWTGNGFDLIVESTKTELDDWLLEWLRNNWRDIISQLTEIPDDLQDIHDATEAYFESLNLLTPKAINAQKAKLASIITQRLNTYVNGTDIDEWEADYMVATVYVDAKKTLDIEV